MVDIDINNENIKQHIKRLLDIDIYERRSIKACPNCNSKAFIKHGSYQNKQRFLCKSCSKTFCNRTNTLFYRSKKSAVLWAEFINLMLSKKSLRNTSCKLNISLSTAFYWRHKLLHSLCKFKEPATLGSIINMIKIFTKENYKGDRNAPLAQRKKVWNIIAQDSDETILASPISIGKWDRVSFDKIIYSKIYYKSYINVYCDSYLNNIAKKHNKGFKERKNILHETMLWRYIKELKDTLKKYNGVATKYLKRYLYFSSIFSVEGKYDYRTFMYNLSSNGTYIMYKDLKSVPTIPSL